MFMKEYISKTNKGQNVNILVIGTDEGVFQPGSAVRKRVKDYAADFKSFNVLVKTRNQALAVSSEGALVFYPAYSPNIYSFLKSAYLRGARLLSAGDNWVISVENPFETALVGWLLGLRYGASLQIQVHTDVFSQEFWKESFANKVRVIMARFFLSRADGIRVVSERIKNSLLVNLKPNTQNLTPKISVLPIFVDAKKIQSAKVKVDLHQKYPDHNFIILMASRLTKEKNIGLAIEAMKEILSPKTHNLKPLLLIVGDGPERESLELKAKNLNLEANIRFEPAVDSRDLVSYYKTADLFLLTSNYEGYGRTVIEAMAAGCPVVMTDVGLAGELLVDELDGLVVPVGDKAALIEAVSELIGNKEKRENLVYESQKIINSLPEKKEYLADYSNLLTNIAKQEKPKLVYFVPEYDEKTPTHFSYLYGFIKELEKDFEIFLITEKIGSRIYDFLPVRVFRIAADISRARLAGYKDFYIHYSFLGAFIASLFVKFFGGRVFYWNCGEPWKYKRGILRESFERLTYKLITFLVTGSEGLKSEYSEYYNLQLKKIKVMPNWIDVKSVAEQVSSIRKEDKKRELRIPEGAGVLLFVHRLSKRKGAHHLPEILNRLKGENIISVIIGDGPEREAINLQLTIHNLQHLVRMLGWVPQNEVLDYFAIADVLLMPSEEEGFPHVLLEAMATGTPFVASDVGAVKEIVPPELLNYVIPAGDIDGFSGKSKELLSKSEKEIKELNSKLESRAREYDIHKSLNKFKALFR